MNARPLIDSLYFARNGKQISGEAQLADLPRLHDLLESTQGTLSYVIRGSVDKQDNPVLNLGVVGHCRLMCQRCLQGMDHSIHLEARLVLREQAELDVLEDEDDEFDSILADAKLDVLDLLEEEILLSLPIAPKHGLGGCQAKVEAALQQETHPFAALAKLKK